MNNKIAMQRCKNEGLVYNVTTFIVHKSDAQKQVQIPKRGP